MTALDRWFDRSARGVARRTSRRGFLARLGALLVDDMGFAGRDLSLAVADSHPNLEVRIFNPFSRETGRTSQFVTRMDSVTRRMHSKSFTVDNQAAILGGRNIGNEYFDADPDLAFADLDVLSVGPVAPKVSAEFDLYWNHELAYPVSVLIKKQPTPEEIEEKRQKLNDFVREQEDSAYIQALRDSELAGRLRADQVEYHWGDAVVVYDQPEKLLHDFDEIQYHLSPLIKPYFESVKDELIIFSPYFVPGKEGTAFLTELSKRGVRVRILTNSLFKLSMECRIFSSVFNKTSSIISTLQSRPTYQLALP